MKLISVVTPCYNEQGNVRELYTEVKKAFAELKDYKYEHIFIDNSSTDNTVNILKEIASTDKNVKIIINLKNYGHLKSPFYGIMQAKGEAVILMVADFQDPPYLIGDFVKNWEKGYKIVAGVKTKSRENPLMFLTRKIYYSLIKSISSSEQIKNFTGFGLYDRSVIEILRQYDERYPYFRGLISELGFEICRIEFTQPKRRKGKSKNNFFTLFDLAMLGMVSYSVLPLRIATFVGSVTAAISFIIAVFYFFYKVIFWNGFQVGMAPLVIGIFFFASVQLFFIGIIGEYIGVIYTQTKKRPLVIEKERVNF
jgi:glycosyltransferase involved in cell wall biosynthesis